jgi:hypothetical protein
VVKNTLQINSKNCVSNGNCVLKLTPNKNITFQKDKFDNLYPIITDGEKTLLTFTFKKNTLKNTQDSNYTEIIYAELPKNIKEISLQDNTLKQLKLHFARLCFCKGETGYYPIEKGSFNLKKINKDSIKITCNFKVKNIPQVISSFEETVSIKSN